MLRHITLIALFAIACFGGRAIADSDSLLGNGRIVGGTDADIRQYPHQVSLRYRGRHFCGGSIYSANIIVTATHCVDDEDPTDISIVAGVSKLDEVGVDIPVVKIVAHEKYSALNDYDVAILLLASNLTFNESIQPIALAKERPAAGTELIVTGWGTLVEDGSLSNRLQQVTVNLVEQSSCRRSYLLLLTKRMLCAGMVGGGKDSCQGDSGGPLIVGKQLLGIVSWGFGCASKNFPGVYASVPDLAEWIEATVDVLTNSGVAVIENYSYL